MIACQTLGPADVRVNGAAPPAELLWKKNLALLVYLARSPKRVRTREHLIGLLWADKSDKDARHSLNEAVRVLRHVVGDGGLESDAAQVRIAPGAVELDTDTLEALAAKGDYIAAAGLVHGEFLEGFSVPRASEFDTWLAAEREHWRRRSVDVLVRRADQLIEAGSLWAATEMVRRARELDWRSEVALRTALRGLALAGDRAGGLALFEVFAARLKDELDAEPDADTRALAERIRNERRWRLPKGAAAASGSGAHRAPLVGRGAELGRLVDAWAGCRARRRATVAAIEGDAGTGKTRLAEELVARARLDGAAISCVRAVEADRREAWSGLFGIARGGLLEAPGVAGAPPPALALLRGTAPSESPGRALSEVLQAVADEQPVLVYVDDAHWLDRESLLALGAAARDLAQSPVLFLFGAAPQPPSPELDHLRTRVGRELAGAVVTLTSLGTDAVHDLARWMLPSYEEGQLDRLSRRVHVDSAGIPLLVVALLRAVAAGLELRDAQTPWPEPFRTLDQTLPGELPDNILAAIRINFRRLSSDAQRVLVAAAVLGGRVSGATLGRAAEVAADGLPGALDELEWQGWLTAEPRGYAFVARIVQEVIERDMVRPGQRQRMLEAAALPPSEPESGRPQRPSPL